ncbi:MAG: hypothetical protein HY203_11235 [Nitrospirae bacterium]|nr:hypothetical protein [Nitrospirota bacterium]
MYKHWCFIFLIPLLSIGCGKDQNVNTHIQEGASGGTGIIINVSDGNPISKPVYSWFDTNNNSDTTASRVTVAPNSPNNAPPVWDVFDATLQNSIHSPVVHGPPPPGSAQQVVNPELDLQTNVWYRVTVTKGNQTTTGFREFLILP